MAINKSTPYRILQAAFTAGELSNKVENRADLDKYQYAILRGDNALIHPCGPLYRRAGMKYIASAKYNNAATILVPFASGGETDYMLEMGNYYIRVYYNGAYVGVELSTPFPASILTKLRFTQSADTMFIASGDYPVKRLSRYSHTDWRLSDYAISEPYFDETLSDASENCTMQPNGTSGNVTITSSEDVFTSGMVGASIQLKQDVDSSITSATVGKGGSTTSGAVYVGEQWKVETSGTWKGTVVIQRSLDGSTWKDFRRYSSSNSNNYTESGTSSVKCYLRFVASNDSDATSDLTVNLTGLAYSHTGWCTIFRVDSARSAAVTVNDRLGTTNATKNWALSPWCSAYGYPRTVCFFQDRLCFGGTKYQPYTVWMSRTGNYASFEVEKASGNVLDDSAVCISFISRNQYSIKHMIPAKDLMIMTNGNEWIVSGSEVITPSACTPQLQTSRGCNEILPMLVGNRLVYVQRRGSFVRDMGYRYDTDSYGGDDLTLLASHIIEGHTLIDAAYKQEPDSTIYFVRDDGVLACLAYVYEQKVYAWSTIQTNGSVLAIATIQEGDADAVYILVERNINGSKVRYIERMGDNARTDIPNDYIMLDCAKVFSSDSKTDTFSLPHLAGATVDAIGDGRVYKNYKVDSNGVLKLPGASKKLVAGMPYSFKLQMLNVNIGSNGNTSQGLNYHIAGVSMRLLNALGGKIGTDFDTMDDIHFDEYLNVGNTKLFSGDKSLTLPLGGYETENKLCIMNNDPYPFCLLSVVREVVFGD